jgi:hypothetical protein
VSADEVVFQGLLDLRHMTSYALAACACFGMVSVLADCAVKSGRIVFCVAAEADCISSCDEACLVFTAVDLMAARAANFAMIHIALNEIISLHAIFVRGHVCELIEVCDAGLHLFKLPVVG